MKQQAVKLEVVYKIVQVRKDGRMFSANPNGDLTKQETSVEYFLNSQVLPLTNRPKLFVLRTLAEARVGKAFYSRSRPASSGNVSVILKCLASNLKTHNSGAIVNVGDSSVYTPHEFPTTTCDWLIPIKVVK